MRSPMKIFTVTTLRWLLTLSMVGGIVISHAETCGNDTVFTHGFEVATFIPVAQLSGGVPSASLTQDITGPANPATFSVSITSPVSGTTSESAVDVVGNITGPVNTGILVNGVLGYVANGRFLVPNVPLTANSSNSVSLTATKLTGQTTTTAVTLTQSGQSLLSLQANHVAGFAPLIVTFSETIGTLPNPLLSVAIDFNGDSVNDYTGPSLTGAPSSYTYTQAGVYTARFTVTDIQNLVYTTTRSVIVQDLATQRSMACNVIGYLKDRLTNTDATNAALTFQPLVQSNYLNLFNTLGTSKMPAAAQKLGTITNGIIGSGTADLILVRDNENQTRNGYPVHLTQGSDGVLRISEM